VLRNALRYLLVALIVPVLVIELFLLFLFHLIGDGDE
jgi:hypothetical protein